MEDVIICSVTNLFRVYLISGFMHMFLADDKKKRKWRLLVYGGFFVVNTAAYLLFHTAWINITCNLAGIGLIALAYTKSIKMILFVTGTIYLINMGCDLISILPFVRYRDGVSFHQIYEVITVFLIFICELIAQKIVDARRKAENETNISLSLVPLFSVGMLCIFIYSESVTEFGLLIASVGLVLINFFTLYLYNMLSVALSNQYENEVLKQKVQGYANQLDVILRGEEKVRALRHDMKHHLMELKIMAEKGEDEAIVKYIGNMEEFMENRNEIVASGNLEIDSVINYMIRRAREELQIVNVNVRMPKSVSYSFDINVILGNLLENGIEAASQTAEKRLDVMMELKQGILRIQIENSYTGKSLFGYEKGHQRLLTTKSEKGAHGIGLENVRRMVEKYNGIMEITPGEDTFRVTVLLYMSEIKEKE